MKGRNTRMENNFFRRGLGAFFNDLCVGVFNLKSGTGFKKFQSRLKESRKLEKYL